MVRLGKPLKAREGTISLRFMPPKIKLQRKELKEKEWEDGLDPNTFACMHVRISNKKLNIK